MPGSAFELDLSELDGLTGDLVAAMNRLKTMDQAQLLHELGVELEGQTKERFDEKVGPDGSPWKAWSPRYAERQRKYNPGASILRGGGPGLYESISSRVSGGRLSIGSRLVYAGVHQEGWAAKNIPARPYLGISRENQEDLVTVMTEFVRRTSGGVL